MIGTLPALVLYFGPAFFFVYKTWKEETACAGNDGVERTLSANNASGVGRKVWANKV